MIKSIQNYFDLLCKEIIKALKPVKPNTMTILEIQKELQHKNKNELVRILIKLIADQDRTFNVIENKHDIKKYSKKQFIRAILTELIEQNKRKEVVK
jgi:hypothetical protein